MVETMKVCTKCKKEKEIEMFSRDKWKKDGRQPECKQCNHDFHFANRERILVKQREYTQRNKTRILQHRKEKRYKERYGITIEQKRRMWIEQQGRCKICSEEMLTAKHCHVDHDHKSREVRGLICNHCNRGLGGFRDNITYLHSAIQYLSRQ